MLPSVRGVARQTHQRHQGNSLAWHGRENSSAVPDAAACNVDRKQADVIEAPS
jgi:hypothetical protein